MKASTLIGIIIGSIAIFGAFLWEGGNYDSLFLAPPMLIVFGGTLAAGLAGSSWAMFSKIPILLKTAFFPKKYEVTEIIHQIVMYSYIARKEGILSIENELDNAKHPYMKKLFRICIDGADPQTLEQIFDSEAGYITDRHNANIKFFIKLGGYSPTMGIIGTVMGLISTLASAGSDPNVLIQHIASAFIATMWGIFMANIVWLPIGDKLQALHNIEMTVLQVILDGVKSVQLGETPSVIQTRLVGVLPLSEQDKFHFVRPPKEDPPQTPVQTDETQDLV